MTRVLKIGTRASPLAQAQAKHVQALLKTHGQESELVLITTSGDRIQDRYLSEVGGKALFTKEIERALLEGEADLAVHSIKDVETVRPKGIILASILARHDPRDALITREDYTLKTLPEGATLGTASARRAAQLKELRDDLNIVMLRGNVGTRLQKLQDGDVDATFLALAGLERLGIQPSHLQPLAPEHMVPSAGQGALGLECLENDPDLVALLQSLEDPKSRQCVELERLFLHLVGGDCHTPVGIYVKPQEGADLLETWIFVGNAAQDASLRFYEASPYEMMRTQILNWAKDVKAWLKKYPSMC
ncbi:MAG: hydroxymethylbilane synthase [Alphaproteobacteria bacterium]|jgi:hydroxymethylbilane synthase|nr:hydroxymethylbilane synthase [Alphaproteobacteria bacterium]